MNDTSASQLAMTLYEAVLDGDGLLGAAQAVAGRLGASSYAVHRIRYRNGRPAESRSAGRGGIAGPAMDEYARFWVKHDPWARAGAMLPIGVHDIRQYVPPDQLARSRIWNEWGRPNDAAFHALGVVLRKQQDETAGLFFHRHASEPAFDTEQLDIAAELLPHLRRAFATADALAVAPEAVGRALPAALDALADGIVLLDAERRLVFANAALHRMAAMRDGLALAARDGLDAADPKARHGLARAVTAALAALDGQVGLLPAAGSLALPRPSGGAPWLVRATPVQRNHLPEAPIGFRGVMLVVVDGERRARPNAALLGRVFGLTPAQAHLAAAIAGGRTLREHARGRMISVETARTHLAAIRRKTGTKRQAELALLFAKLPG